MLDYSVRVILITGHIQYSLFALGKVKKGTHECYIVVVPTVQQSEGIKHKLLSFWNWPVFFLIIQSPYCNSAILTHFYAYFDSWQKKHIHMYLYIKMYEFSFLGSSTSSSNRPGRETGLNVFMHEIKREERKDGSYWWWWRWFFLGLIYFLFQWVCRVRRPLRLQRSMVKNRWLRHVDSYVLNRIHIRKGNMKKIIKSMYITLHTHTHIYMRIAEEPTVIFLFYHKEKYSWS